MGFLYSQLFITPKYPTESFKGKTIIVTGSNTGLGREAARHFARLNADKVIIAVRNLKAGEEAKRSIEESTGRPGSCEVWELDLASYASTKAFAARVNKLPRLDVLLENASIAPGKLDYSEGHERSITVNLINTYLLLLLALPKLKATAKQFPDAHPVASIVASEVHAWAKFPEWKADNIIQTLDTGASMGERYQTSKLLQVLILREIAPRLAGSGVTLNTLNPGLCRSELVRELDSWGARLMMKFMHLVLARTTEVGSRTLVAAAAAGPETHGGYMSDGVLHNDLYSPFVQSEDGKKAQKKLWKELSEILDSIEPGISTSF